MAPKRAKRGKSKVASKPEVVFDQLRFLTPKNKQTFETLIKRKRIWGERQINLHELHPFVYENLRSRHWLSLCTNIEPDQLRFLTPKNKQTFETLIKRKRIWGERQINLHELHPSVFLIHRVLKYLELQNFPSQELVHIQAPIGAKFLKQQSAQKKFGDPSVGSSKRPGVQSNTGDVPYEDMHGDPTAAVVEDGDDEVDVDTTVAAQISPPPSSLRAMMETIMTTQATHG
nr:hypothetical protein CFP56_75987 [Quercus suber]